MYKSSNNIKLKTLNWTDTKFTFLLNCCRLIPGFTWIFNKIQCTILHLCLEGRGKFIQNFLAVPFHPSPGHPDGPALGLQAAGVCSLDRVLAGLEAVLITNHDVVLNHLTFFQPFVHNLEKKEFYVH